MRPAIIGPLGPAQLTCIRSWLRQGWSPLFIQLGESPAPALLKRLLGGYLHLPSSKLDHDASARIVEFLKRHNATGIASLSPQVMLWLHDYKHDFDENMSLWIPSRATLEILESKSRQLAVAREVGLPTLRSINITDGTQTSISSDQFPLVLRPDNPALIAPSFKMQLIKSEPELRSFLGGLTRFGGGIVGQRFIHGPNLVVHGVRTADGEHQNLAAFRVGYKLNGVSLTIEPTELPAHISTGCQSFVECIGHVGVYHFDFLQDADDGSYYFLEINGRLGGTTGKVFAAGYDEPVYLINAFADTMCRQRTETPILKSGIYSNKRSVSRAIANATRGRGTIFDYPLGQSKRALLPLSHGLLQWHDEIFTPGYMRTAVAYTIHTLRPNPRTAGHD